ncbi:MAG: DEAD/DEAH box helicase [Coriobacteriia bacterium]|nr:DEAD/DEAH box helicase [Coriobacteriia bacterium]
MTDFESLGLSAQTLKAVDLLGYESPTPIQEKAIPCALAGQDLIAGAQTGTGKTTAFCLPCLDQLPHARKNCGPLMLVITPTRELADQITEVCSTISQATKHKITTVVGGVSYNPQREALKRGTDVLIATPGRLEDLIGQGAANLDQVQVLVLDEADRMLDMGFLPAIKRIVGECTGEHQTLLFSATIDKQVEKVAQSMLKDPQKVEVARRGETAKTVEQFIVRISHAAKPSALKAVLDEHGAKRVIVFARTRHRADACSRRLRRAGYKTGVIHSDRSQNQRRRALDAFDKGQINVLVATDVLARGIDIDQVDYVVNYDLPTQPEDYVHRIGRTGRAGAKGFAVSLVNPEVEGDLKAIQKLIKRDIPEMELKTLNRDQVEADAEARSAQLQARRSKDPEVQAAVKELAKEKSKQRKKAAKQAQESKPERSQKQGGGKRKAGAQPKPKGKSGNGGQGKNAKGRKGQAQGARPAEPSGFNDAQSFKKDRKSKAGSKAKNRGGAKSKSAQPKSQIKTYTHQKDASRPRPGRFSSGLR